MADRKITELTAMSAGTQATGDLLTIVDVSEAAAVDKNKKITVESLFQGIPGNVGIGKISSGNKLEIEGQGNTKVVIDGRTDAANGSDAILELWSKNSGGTNNFGFIDYDGDGNFEIGSGGGGAGSVPLVFKTNAVERLRISSDGKVGIGTTSPAGGLHVDAASGVDGPVFDSGGTGNTNHALLVRDSGNSQLFRVNNNGNVGIGASSPEEILHIAAASETVNSRDGVILESTSALAADTGLPLVFTSHIGNVANYGIASIAGRKENATSGDAAGYLQFATGSSGGAISERMRIDSSGNLNFAQEASSSYPEQKLKWSNDSTTTNGFYISQDSSRNGKIFHEQGLDIVFGTNNAEAMRIDSSGNVGIGTTSPNAKLDVNGNVEFGDGGGFDMNINGTRHQFSIGGSEKMRLDSSGRLLVGTTSSYTPNALIQVVKASGSCLTGTRSNSLANGNFAIFAASARNSSAGGYRNAEMGLYKNSSNTNPSGYLRLDPDDGSSNFLYFDNSNLFRFSTVIGNIGTTSGTVIGTQTSDERLKNVGADVAYGLAEIKQLQPKQYALKTEPDTNKLGFIAQQVESIIPEAVFDSTDPLPGHEEGDRTKLGMEYVQIIPVLVNAIKELSAEVDTLKTKVAALEAG
nr:hypothetical protein [uncultured Mediterranean phage uvMED]